MKPNANIAIIVLAAGASKRMGSPKQLLKWGNYTLLNHTIKTCKATIAKEIFVVLGANFSLIKSQISEKSITVINNTLWEMGLGASIAQAATYILNSQNKCNGLLFVLADQPFITSTFLNKILNNFISNNKSIVATRYNEYKKGVPVLFDKYFFEELSQISGDDGAKSILKKYNNLVKTVCPNFKNIDIDTPKDYRDIIKISN